MFNPDDFKDFSEYDFSNLNNKANSLLDIESLDLIEDPFEEDNYDDLKNYKDFENKIFSDYFKSIENQENLFKDNIILNQYTQNNNHVQNNGVVNSKIPLNDVTNFYSNLFKPIDQLSNKTNFNSNDKPSDDTKIQNINLTKSLFSKELKSVDEIPSKFRNVFSKFPYFNYVQSIVFDDVFYTNKNMVISAPTSSGKTVILELAIVRLLTLINFQNSKNSFKIIYMAPLKALCTEKFNEWTEKFDKLHNVKCIELTGDTEIELEDNLKYLENSNIICTTPEKWDLVTRKYKNRLSIMKEIKLFLIDEIHVLGEPSRGAVIEAVISRMKKFAYSNSTQKTDEYLRFIAISATIPNIDDFSSWLSSGINQKIPAIIYKLNDNYRPVKLKKVVLGHYCPPKMTDYCFDLSLNYKLANVIRDYSNNKPTLVFCSTRKGTLQAAQILIKTNQFIKNIEHKKYLYEFSKKIKDPKLKELIVEGGIGFHHAGMDTQDRHLIESLFLKGNLFVLFSTSTLSIGVNLPAHLVIIKSTMYYTSSQFIDYSNSQILQMIGRAGRPQFDDTGTAVIMTKQIDRNKYESLFEGTQLIESQLHKSLIEHLNVEIVLGTICNLNEAINWLKSTFLYVRVSKNPSYYGINLKNNKLNQKSTLELIDEYLSELCIQNLNELRNVNMIEDCDFITDSFCELKSALNGHLMANYCLLFETMKLIIMNLSFRKTNENEPNESNKLYYQPRKSLNELIDLISTSKEFEDIKLRTNEKSILNNLNNNGKLPKNKAAMENVQNDPNIIRYLLDGKIKNHSMKINVLMQSQFGSIAINDFSLNQDIYKIFRISQRISRCLLEYLTQTCYYDLNKESPRIYKNYETFINSVMIHKCITTRLWYDSPHVFKQFSRIGTALSQAFVKKNITSFSDILKLDAHQIELILNKNPPFGSLVLETVKKLPQLKIEFVKVKNGVFDLKCILINYQEINSQGNGGTLGYSAPMLFIVGDENINLLCSNRLNIGTFLKNNGVWSRRLYLDLENNGSFIHASLIFLSFVGLDVHESFTTFVTTNNSNAPNDKTNNQIIRTKKNCSIDKYQENELIADSNEVNTFISNYTDEEEDRNENTQIKIINNKTKQSFSKRKVSKSNCYKTEESKQKKSILATLKFFFYVNNNQDLILEKENLNSENKENINFSSTNSNIYSNIDTNENNSLIKTDNQFRVFKFKSLIKPNESITNAKTSEKQTKIDSFLRLKPKITLNHYNNEIKNCQQIRKETIEPDQESVPKVNINKNNNVSKLNLEKEEIFESLIEPDLDSASSFYSNIRLANNSSNNQNIQSINFNDRLSSFKYQGSSNRLLNENFSKPKFKTNTFLKNLYKLD